jgi:hypothetical protein
MEDIRDIKGLVPLPHGLWWLGLLLAVAAAAAVAFWLWKRRKPATPGAIRVPLTPFEVAARALRQLREENPPVDEFYTRLSDIVRRYLEGQLGLRAPERTTEEFLYETSRDHALSSEHRDLLAAFLQESDLVKFARFRPGEEDKQRAWAAAERFVRETGLVGQASRLSALESQTRPTGETPVRQT